VLNSTGALRVDPRGPIIYSRPRGLFAGVSLEGTSTRPDDDASEQVSGRKMTARNVVTGKRTGVPASGRHLDDVLEKNAPHNDSKVTRTR
jgi:lipid-binding SYLF domain-containing protein